MSGVNLLVEYRIHQEKFKNMDRFYDVVRSAMNKLGHTESNTKGDINFYNHLENNNKFSNDVIILKEKVRKFAILFG